MSNLHLYRRRSRVTNWPLLGHPQAPTQFSWYHLIVSKLSVHRLESDIISNGHEDFSLRMPCVVQDSAVPFLPNSPVHQDSHRIEITPVRLGCMLPGTKPPVCGVDETSSRNREVCCCPKASLLPDGSGERAVDEEVLCRFQATSSHS
jgi:hypothetical protein